ncbi:isoprenyl transferase [Rhabdaerophilum calidifontis]|uniref:isoprenyl transferase n=1 Tax=Rhabdaerophilum calidifontis TaxID=2604328 RepID=UPI001238DF13
MPGIVPNRAAGPEHDAPAPGASCGVVHLAFIMDGNGRWATQRGLPRVAGHRAGLEAVRRLVRAAIARGIGYLTLYSFSTENWARPAEEVGELMRLLRFFIRSDLATLNARNVRVRIIGEREGLPEDILALLREAEAVTAANTGLMLIVAFNYGARAELVRATRRLAEEAASGRIAPEAIGEAEIAARLDTAGIPDPDLLIRSSGEQRISNFLLWQCAYTEFVFSPVLWPDFDEAALDAALAEFSHRHRRFGGL